VEGYIQTRFDQAQLLHKGFAQPLNVVIIKALLIPAASSAPPVSVRLTTIASMAKTFGVALTLLDVE